MKATVKTADLSGPLPTGTSVLEASAGTGKTWTIAGLVARYVAEGRATIDQLLVVTFGRAATSELRSRVRERLMSVAACLADGGPSTDPVVTLLRDNPKALQRLRTALASFDSATVATTHGFCEQVLRSFGVLSDLDPGTVLVENLDDLIAETVSDLYLGSLATKRLPFDPEPALTIARQAIYDPEALLLPVRDEGSEGQQRQAFATKVRAEVERRKRTQRLLTYDDQLARVRAALTDPETGPAACERLRSRFSVVLVDEFQDTDPVQWDILRSAFHGHRTLVVIGDPKQAIYAFRGADVSAYLTARHAADEVQTLGTNWRSDAKVLDGLRTLLRGAALGDAEIVVTDVAAGQTSIALGPAADPKPVRLRWCSTELFGGKAPNVGPARERVAADAAQQVVDLLAEGLTFTPRGSSTVRPLDARDIAILTRTGVQAGIIRDALAARGVPCILSGTSSVFITAAAKDWVLFLDALEQPQSRGRVRRAALTSLIGITAAELDGEPGAKRADDLAQQLREWAAVLADRGAAGLFAAVSEERNLSERVLRYNDGERVLTDLRQIAEIVHRQGIEAQLGLAGLVSWLRERVADTNDLNQERSRRLDTESAAVQVLTVHVSKGLEFPVVLVPFGWDLGGGGSKELTPRGHDAAGKRTLFVGGKNDPDYKTACAGEESENAGEELRLLYVAVTRAVSRLVLWWAPVKTKTPESPLHRLLFAPDPSNIPETVKLPSDSAVRSRLAEVAGDVVRVEPVGGVGVGSVAAATTSSSPLTVAEFDRGLDTAWRRTSYSGLTRDAHEAGPAVSSESDGAVKDDEPEIVDDSPAVASPLLEVASPLAKLQGGTAFGTLVHEVLELADLGVDPEGALTAAVAERLPRSGLTLPAEELVTGLLTVVATPLGPLVGGRSLAEIPRADQLRELDFELPLAGGDEPVAGDVTLGAISGLLREHLPPGDPVLPYADVLDASGLGWQTLRGYLTGSIDVVLRVDGRYVIVDHKTNRLAAWDEPLTAWHYRRSALDSAMLAAHYPLQAMLYSVALHRYLRWRLSGYRPEEQLGGTLYLFLRGMCGPGVAAGVWSWQPPAQLVEALSDLLAGVVL